jgi:hypothetical protein
MAHAKLKSLYNEVKSHTDFTRKSIPFFVEKIRDIKVELLKLEMEQGEQVSRDVTYAARQINITERESLNNIQSYPDEIPKFLKRVKEAVIANLAFANK